MRVLVGVSRLFTSFIGEGARADSTMGMLWLVRRCCCWELFWAGMAAVSPRCCYGGESSRCVAAQMWEGMHPP